jgi:uncharacterized protein YndB with AHSA1/START domain
MSRPAVSRHLRVLREAGRWWPEAPSFGGKAPTNMIIEGRVGGRFYQVDADGTEFEIGRVTAYQPPHFVAFTWRAPSWDATTEVEVRFVADGTGTRIQLEHSGWERTEKVREFRKGYEGGWGTMLGHYQSFVAAAA